MNVSVFGIGYVGCVSATCLANLGHNVIGVDVDPDKVASINEAVSPIVEPGLSELILAASMAGQLRATTSASEAVSQSELSLICVGTPSNPNGSLNLEYLENVCREIGTSLAAIDRYHTVVVRSTVLPKSGKDRLIPILEQFSGLKAGQDFGYSMNPEFLREGSAVRDFLEPSQIVIGAFDDRSAASVEQLYAGLSAPVVRTSINIAEMVKYVSNAFHALKIVFANEMGNLCKALETDGREVMDIFCRDHQLNISPAYLKPGFGFGGSCLPKDMRALVYSAKRHDVECPLLHAALDSNQRQIQRGIQMIEHTGRKKVGVLGLSFKAGTDDIRESPMVPLIETLVGRGYDVKVFDRDVKLDKLVGKNKHFIERELPHITSLMRSGVEEIVAASEVVVVANANSEYRRASSLMHEGQILIDLVGIPVSGRKGMYEGICW
jgi:GDP-mannose 6-dehydrogenase